VWLYILILIPPNTENPSLSGTISIFFIAVAIFFYVMSQFQSGKESGEKKKAKKEKSKLDKKEKTSFSGNPTIINRNDFPSPEEVTVDWRHLVPISEATDDGEELPHGLRRPEIQACFVKEGYQSYQDVPPRLGLQLLLLSSKTEDWDRTSKIWQYCTNMPPPRPDRWDTLEVAYERMISSEKQKSETESPVEWAEIRNIMGPTSGGRVPLDLHDLDSHETNAEEHAGERESEEKFSSSPLHVILPPGMNPKRRHPR